MDEYWIDKSWLKRRIRRLDSPRWSEYVGQLRSYMQEGDEIWTFDEPAPPGINAGAMGLAIVRGGEPVRTIIIGVH